MGAKIVWVVLLILVMAKRALYFIRCNVLPCLGVAFYYLYVECYLTCILPTVDFSFKCFFFFPLAVCKMFTLEFMAAGDGISRRIHC